jgi:urease accessory protein
MRFTMPFKVQHPHYGADDHLLIMVLAVSAGIMAGDTQEILIEMDAGAQAEVTSQSYEKIHKMEEGQSAQRSTRIKLDKESRLSYAPLPVIPFAQSDFCSLTEIELEDESCELLYSDIMSCGRVAHGEQFAFRRYGARMHLTCKNELIYADNLILEPDTMKAQGIDITGLGYFEGYSHYGQLLLHSPQVAQGEAEERAHEAVTAASECHAGFSLAGDNLLCVRALAQGSEPLLELRALLSEAFGMASTRLLST